MRQQRLAEPVGPDQTMMLLLDSSASSPLILAMAGCGL
ncbi:hypothetical protein D554_3841 [Bordetella holmesii 30539]|nr:hypothetical protein D554_3841 [Bordetella holmesii 30539]